MTKQYWGDAATMNCVWLFQIKRTAYKNGCECGAYDDEGNLKEGETCDCGFDYWETTRVFLTQQETREYGQARPYAWGNEDEGWRIYGVPADGIMIEILGKHNLEFKDKVDCITEVQNE